ncbi:MAG: zinc ABC transporter substrate-binding protein, partial [Clostridiales bacterium]|nr:zinc ABC transporter substrate-binding protein [Clostridiales bacterium]
KADELDLGYILVIEGKGTDIAQSVINNTSSKDQEVLVLDSLQSVTDEDISNGASYISIMTEDLEVLKTALS